MELTTLYKRVIGLDVHQAQITACTIMHIKALNLVFYDIREDSL